MSDFDNHMDAAIEQMSLAVMSAPTCSTSSAYMLEAAHHRFVEFQALMTMGAGRQYPFNPKLQPLINAINDFVASVDEHVNREIDGETGNAALEEVLMQREEAASHLDQARIAGCALLVHLDRALHDDTASPQLSLVS
jgi:hypothetical protein